MIESAPGDEPAPAPGDEPAIDMAGICKFFHLGDQTVHALDRVDLRIRRGEYVSVQGPSGSGKSTLLHRIGLLDRPDTGRYRLAGVDTAGLADDRLARLRGDQVGFVFQAFHLIPRLTAAENVEIPLILLGIPVGERRARVAAALADLDLGPRAHHRPDQLSGGQRQRVAIARATVMRPPLLLADEPTGNLDRASGEQVMRILEALVAAGRTLILVTHDQDLGRRAPRQIRMLDGQIVSDSGGPASP